MVHLRQHQPKISAITHGIVLVCLGLFALLFISPASAAPETPPATSQNNMDPKKIQKLAKTEAVATRPDDGGIPTEIHFLGFIIDIDSFNDSNQNFEANVFIRLRWQDKRLADPKATDRQIDIDDIWNPRILITNQQGILSTALPKVALVKPDGTVIYRQRFTGTLSQPLNLIDFPMDKHTFTIQFIAAGYTDDMLKFVPDTEKGFVGGGIADKLSLPDWKISDFVAKAYPYRPVGEISSAGFVLQFKAQRLFAYYIWQIILPFSVVMIMSWSAFWVGRDQLGIRIGVATSSILTLIANRFVISTLLPKLPYMTRMDYFSVCTTILVLFALVLVILGALFENNKELLYAKKIDFWSRIVFPAAYSIIMALFLLL